MKILPPLVLSLLLFAASASAAPRDVVIVNLSKVPFGASQRQRLQEQKLNVVEASAAARGTPRLVLFQRMGSELAAAIKKESKAGPVVAVPVSFESLRVDGRHAGKSMAELLRAGAVSVLPWNENAPEALGRLFSPQREWSGESGAYRSSHWAAVLGQAERAMSERPSPLVLFGSRGAGKGALLLQISVALKEGFLAPEGDAQLQATGVAADGFVAHAASSPYSHEWSRAGGRPQLQIRGGGDRRAVEHLRVADVGDFSPAAQEHLAHLIKRSAAGVVMLSLDREQAMGLRPALKEALRGARVIELPSLEARPEDAEPLLQEMLASRLITSRRLWAEGNAARTAGSARWPQDKSGITFHSDASAALAAFEYPDGVHSVRRMAKVMAHQIGGRSFTRPIEITTDQLPLGGLVDGDAGALLFPETAE